MDQPDHATLHHIGFVVFSIQDCVESFARSVGASWDGCIIPEPEQRVRVAFLRGRNPGEAMVELVEPDGADSPVTMFLKRRGGLHHLCYEVDDIESHLRFCESVGTKIIRRPVPAVSFGGRRIAWAITRNKLVVEFLERTIG
jgi:methylmalonyl-CoA/ethylmalonyl-CoA epimerase